jgi:hypothetical protein
MADQKQKMESGFSNLLICLQKHLKYDSTKLSEEAEAHWNPGRRASKAG